MNATEELANMTAFVTEEIPQFTLHDYLFFAILLLLSALIGVYFGFFQQNEANADEYLLGGKKMGVFEISMSLIASTFSGMTILSVPSEIYRFGFAHWLCVISAIGVLIFSYYCVMPVFTKLKTASTYEYLDHRFDKSIRIISSLLFTLNTILYLPIVIYLPALGLAQGTGFNIHFITPLICCVCIFYTTVGGLKAVVWTDALQLVVMVGATLVVIYIGTATAGGIGAVFSIASNGGRLDFSFDIDPTNRGSVWSVVFGMFFYWNGLITFGQGCVQKCLALSSQRKIRDAYISYGVGIVAFFSLPSYIGLLMYARYQTCDPYTSRKINSHDEMLPFYMLDVTRNTPGLPGIFIAGVFCASLSTLSAWMSAVSCTLYEDFIRQKLSINVTQRQINLILKTIVVIVGVLCTALVFVVQNVKSIMEIGLTVANFTQGPAMGLFVLGLFVPKANTKGALAGIIGAVIIMGWIICTTLYYKIYGYILIPSRDISIMDCVLAPNSTFRKPLSVPTWTPPFIYRISYYYYGFMGAFLVLLIGIPVSYMTRSKKDKRVARELISPAMQWALDDDTSLCPPAYCSVETANQIVVKHS